MKTGLVLEGGALRAIFSSGVCDGLLEGGVMADYVIGVSAGIAYGVSYVSRQPRRNLEVVTRFARDRRYMGLRNLTARDNRCYFGLEFAYSTIPNQLIPFDYDTFAAFPGEVEAILHLGDPHRAVQDAQVLRVGDKLLAVLLADHVLLLHAVFLRFVLVCWDASHFYLQESNSAC